jgi:catechol 2,3-dioxygenase-like lactoylglutathione lyase family enzyme
MEHVGIVVDDLAEAVEFFTALGLEKRGETSVEGEWVGRIIGLEDVKTELAMLRAPEGGGEVELVKFLSPPHEGEHRPEPSNAPGIRHLAFLVDDVGATVEGLRARGTELIGEVVDYKDAYRLCYVRGPAGIIVELAQELS